MADISQFLEREKDKNDILSLNIKYDNFDLNILFLCDRKTFLFAVKGKNIAWQPQCENGKLDAYISNDIYNKIRQELYLGKGWQTTPLFVKVAQALNLNEKINRDTEANKKAYLSSLKKTKTIDDKYGKDGAKPYFWRFKKVNPTLENLEKIKVNLGQQVFEICKENNITVDWTDDETKNEYKPISEIKDEANKKIMPDLDENKRDKVVKSFSVACSMIPHVGGVISEIITNIIPNQRTDRMAEFIRILTEKLKKQDDRLENIENKLRDEKFVELFEECLWQSSKAVSFERKQYIAAILISGLVDDKLIEIQQNVMLNILSQINDIEVIILSSYLSKNDNQEFLDKHKNSLNMPALHFGSSDEDTIEHTIRSTYKEKLCNLGLLKKHIILPKKGEIPIYDVDTGTIKFSGYKITHLGRVFLEYLGV